jgi:beta-mannosidase
MQIPQNWFLGGLDHHGAVWFRREFNYQPMEACARLRIDGIDYFADAYLNGEHLGHPRGYFEPFTFDATGLLKWGRNTLAVRVESPYEQPSLDGWHLHKRIIKGIFNHHDCRPGGGWEPIVQSFNTGGIWYRVTLEGHGRLTIDHLLLRADLEAQAPTLFVTVKVNNRAGSQGASLEINSAPENFSSDSGRNGIIHS